MESHDRTDRRATPLFTRTCFILVPGIATATIGILSLLGWVAGLPLLASFGADLIPVAPSTAILFVVYGITVCLRVRKPVSQGVFWISTAAGCAGTFVALLLFILGCLSTYPEVERLGLNSTGTVEGSATGHMSPVTAAGFLLAGISFLISLSPRMKRPWPVVLAVGSASMLIGTGFIFLLGYLFGAPLLYGGTIIPPALGTTLAFMTLGLALVTLAGRQAELFDRLSAEDSRTAVPLLLIFTCLLAVVVTVGYLYFGNYERNYRQEIENQLSSIAELKTGELERFRKERLADAGILFRNPAFSALALRFLEDPSEEDSRRQLHAWLGGYWSNKQYDQVTLLDDRGVTRMAIPPTQEPVAAPLLRCASETLQSGQVTLLDFYRDEHDRHVYLALLIPVLDESHEGRPRAAVVLRINPEVYLYPFLQKWPTPSATAETLLIRREAKDALYLNDLRFRTGAAVALRLPLKTTQVPAVRAALGQTGIMTGPDYRGVAVIVAARRVSDSPWILVAKLDSVEVSGPPRGRLWQVIILIAALLFGAAACVVLVWRQQREQFYVKLAQAAEELESSEAKHWRILQTAMAGFWVVSAEGRLLEVNETYCRMSGYNAGELTAMRISDLEAVEVGDQTAAHMRRIMAQGEDCFESRHRRKDGSEFDVEVSAQYRAVDGGQFVAFVQDITRRKQAADAMASLRQQSDLILNSAAEGILGLDVQGNHTFVNPAAARMLGYEPEELLGRHSHNLWHHTKSDGSPYPLEECQIYAAYRDGRVHRSTSEVFWRKNGSSLAVEYASTPIMQQGRPVGAVVTFSDITASRQAEASLLNLQKLESLGTLAGGIAHDFNNILTTILGNISLLQSQQKLDGDALELLREAQNACGTAKGLSRQLLTFARGGSPVVKVIDLRPLLKETAGFATRGSKARCVFDLGDSPLAANVDKEQISQVVQNLVINATQAMPQGGDITVRAAPVTLGAEEIPPLGAGRYIRVTVKDQGTGIPAANLSRIFEPYFSTKAAGRGLGLAVCFSILAKHGGHIGVQSDPGKGTTFTLYFPAANVTDIVAERAHPALVTGGGRVLIMDDEAMVAKVLTHMLGRLGYQAESVGDGNAAIDAYKRALETDTPFDVVIMDLTIPGGMGGKEALGKLAALEPKVKVIVSSGYSDDPVMSQYAAHGFSGVLTKPYLMSEVSEAMRLLKDSAPHQQSPEQHD